MVTQTRQPTLEERLGSKRLTRNARATLGSYIPLAEELLLKAKEIGLNGQNFCILYSWAAVELFTPTQTVQIAGETLSIARACELRDYSLAKLADKYPNLVEQFNKSRKLIRKARGFNIPSVSQSLSSVSDYREPDYFEGVEVDLRDQDELIEYASAVNRSRTRYKG